MFNYLIQYSLHIGKMGVQNAYNGTRLFLFNGNEFIPKEEFMDVEFYRLKYVTINYLYYPLNHMHLFLC